MKIIRQSAKLQTPENGLDALRQIEYAGRNCYRSHGKITDDSAPAFVRSLIRRGHLAPLEFADMSVELVTSRDVMAELTRHRLASFCIESQRYVCMNGEIAFILPRFYRESDEASEFWEFCMSDAEQSYHFLLEKGLKPEDARKILPNSTATHIVMKANIREWRHIFSLRLEKGVYPEMRELMELLQKEAKAKIPVVFDDLEVSP